MPYKHGHRPHGRMSAEYHTWCNIHSRCNDPGNPAYEYYGGRGIRVCSRWDDYPTFLADVGVRPSRHHQIDRLHNDRDYEPGNVRWATPTEQSRNRPCVRRLEWQGVTRPLGEWAELVGLPMWAIQWRVKKGWSAERTLTTPVRKRTLTKTTDTVGRPTRR